MAETIIVWDHEPCINLINPCIASWKVDKDAGRWRSVRSARKGSPFVNRMTTARK